MAFELNMRNSPNFSCSKNSIFFRNRFLENNHRQAHHDPKNDSWSDRAKNVKLRITKNVTVSAFFEKERRNCIIALNWVQ